VRRPRRWRALALAAALLIASLPARPAAGHAVLIRSTPAHRAVLARAPARVDLWFSERLEPAYSTASVWDEAGRRVDDGRVTMGPDDPRRLWVALAIRGPGLHTVTYRVLSVDGHIVESRITFTVRAQPP
jgi:copper resistance protein C